MKLRYDNPYNDGAPDFIDLGPYIRGKLINGIETEEYYQLYALLHKDPTRISFGAKYGTEDYQYLSGGADYVTVTDWGDDRVPVYRKEWVITGGDVIHLAAARYFANHHYKGE